MQGSFTKVEKQSVFPQKTATAPPQKHQAIHTKNTPHLHNKKHSYNSFISVDGNKWENNIWRKS